MHYLIDGLAACGIDNVLLCPPEQPLAHCVSNARVVVLPMRGDFDIGATRRLARRLEAEAPDLVHVHSRRGADVHGGRAAELAGLPAILTRRVDSRESGPLARLKYRPYRCIVAISRAVAAQLEGAGVAPERVRIIPSAVDTERFGPDPRARARLVARFGFETEDRIVGIVAQLIERKGHDVALTAVAELAAKHPTLRLLCVGVGPRADTLRQQLARSGLSERVRLAGFRDDVAEWLPGLDVYVHPALREGLGAAVLEAMSAGLPVVASAVGGLIDLIEPGRDGLLVPVRDASALASALDALLGNPVLCARLGAAARERVRRDFTIQAMTRAYAALYRESVAGPVNA